MSDAYKIEAVDNPEESAWGIIGRGIGSYNRQQAGEDDFQRLCFVLRSSDQTIVGGLVGEIYWEWFHIDLLWVTEEIRGQGFGQRILRRGEDEARQRGAKNAYLDTFSFQSPEFYEQNGYQVFGELQEFPAGHQRYFLTKRL